MIAYIRYKDTGRNRSSNNRFIFACLMKIFLKNTQASKWLSVIEILISSYSSLTPTNALTVAWQQRSEPVRVAAFMTCTVCGSDQIFPPGFRTAT